MRTDFSSIVESTEILHSMSRMGGAVSAIELSRQIGLNADDCRTQLGALEELGVVRRTSSALDGPFVVVPHGVLRQVELAFA